MSHGREELPPRPDAGADRDAGWDAGGSVPPRPDAGAGCEVGVIATAEISWEAIDCGRARSPRVVPVSRGADRFALVVDEERRCRDRAAAIHARPLSVTGDVIEAGEPRVLGDSRGAVLHAASFGGGLGVCAGRRLLTEAGFDVGEVELREEPPSLPGCPQSLGCTGIAADGEGWTVGWRFFECDVAIGELGRVTLGGDPRGEVVRTIDRIAAVARDGRGAIAISRPRGPRVSLFAWPRSASEPRAFEVPVDEGAERAPTSVTPWPRPDDAYGAIVASDAGLSVVVFDDRGGVLRSRMHPLTMAGFGPVSVSTAAAPFGVVIGIGWAWSGGAIRSATTLLVLDADAELLLPPVETVHEATGEVLVDVAADGVVALAHRVLAEGRTEAVLIGCR